MKKLVYITSSVIATLVVQVGFFVLFAAPVFAADPVCYQREPANYVQTNPPIVTRALDCSGNPNFHEIEKNVRGHDLEADKCYIIQAGVHGITNGDPFGSDVCNAAEAARIDKGTEQRGDGTPTTQQPTSGGGSSGGTSGGTDSNATGSGAPPHQNNEQKAAPVCDYKKTEFTEEEKKQGCVPRNKEGGFEGVDSNCNVGNAGKDCSITDRLSSIANILAAGVGIVVVVMIMIGGIQYTTSGGDPSKIAAAKSKITNAVIALVAFFFLYAFLQWITPGGIF